MRTSRSFATTLRWPRAGCFEDDRNPVFQPCPQGNRVKTGVACVAALACGIARPGAASAQHCPTPDSWSWEIASDIAAHPVYAGIRNDAGVSSIESGTLRPLADTTDGAACDALLAQVENPVLKSSGWAIGLFEVSGLYLMVFHPLPEAEFKPRIVDGVMYGKLFHMPVMIFRADTTRVVGWFL